MRERGSLDWYRRMIRVVAHGISLGLVPLDSKNDVIQGGYVASGQGYLMGEGRGNEEIFNRGVRRAEQAANDAAQAISLADEANRDF